MVAGSVGFVTYRNKWRQSFDGRDIILRKIIGLLSLNKAITLSLAMRFFGSPCEVFTSFAGDQSLSINLTSHL